LLRRHRDLVRRKWTFKEAGRLGHPTIGSELKKWILQVPMENLGLGFKKLVGELRKLGFDVSYVTIRTVLRRQGIPPFRIVREVPGPPF
jgi:hypothetical protein